MKPGNAPAPVPEQRVAPASAHRCKRVRHRQNECRVCVEVCPEGAITLDPGPTVSDRCTRCGLCQTACPTEAFQGAVHTDQQLLRRIASGRGAGRHEGAASALSVHCREAEPQDSDAVAIPCLGAVTGNFLLGALASGADPVTLVRGDCSRCRLHAGEELFDRAMAAFGALAQVIDLDRSAIRVERRQRSDRAQAARRRFLARVTGLAAQGARDWPAPGTDARESSDAAAAPSVGPTPGRRHLQMLLRGASWTTARSLPHDPRMPWAAVRIDQSDCATCGTCVNLCPTGAITRRIENDRLSHHFNEALCIHCRLCEEACPQQVISFDVRFDARNLMREDAQPITDIPLHACAICGEMLPEREGTFCLTCQRRGKVDGYIPRAVTVR